MTQTQSHLRQRHGGNRNGVVSPWGRLKLSRPDVCLVAAMATIAICWAPAAFGSTGPGVAFKVGTQTLESPITLDKTTRTRYEVELSSQLFCDDHLDFAFTFGGSSLGSFKDEFVEEVDGVLFEDFYSDELSLLDIRLALRLYPFGDSASIRPYVGAGVGYFWFLDSWEDEYYETMEDPFYPGSFITFADSDEDTDTVADGFFPFVLAGVTVPVGDNFEFLFEFEYDFAKEDADYDFGGPIYMFGARFRF